MTEKIQLMKRAPVFSTVRDDSLEFLLDYTRNVTVAAGEFFFRENEQASSVFILESGSAAVLKIWQGQEMRLRLLRSGDCFGEMAFMDLFPRSASVRAENDCTALELSPRGLVRLYGRDVEQFTLIQRNLGREVCRRLRAADERLFRVGMGEPPEITDSLFRAT